MRRRGRGKEERGGAGGRGGEEQRSQGGVVSSKDNYSSIIVFIDNISYLDEKPFIWIETTKIHFSFSRVILTEIQISQSTALICCIYDVTHPLHTGEYLTEMQTVSCTYDKYTVIYRCGPAFLR